MSGSVGTGSLGDVGSEGFTSGGSLAGGWEGSVSGGAVGSDVGGSVEEFSFGITFCSEASQFVQVRLDKPSFSVVGEVTVVHAL